MTSVNSVGKSPIARPLRLQNSTSEIEHIKRLLAGGYPGGHASSSAEPIKSSSPEKYTDSNKVQPAGESSKSGYEKRGRGDKYKGNRIDLYS